MKTFELRALATMRRRRIRRGDQTEDSKIFNGKEEVYWERFFKSTKNKAN